MMMMMMMIQGAGNILRVVILSKTRSTDFVTDAHYKDIILPLNCDRSLMAELPHGLCYWLPPCIN